MNKNTQKAQKFRRALVLNGLLSAGMVFSGVAKANGSGTASKNAKTTKKEVKKEVKRTEKELLDMKLDVNSPNFEKQCRELEDLVLEAIMYTETYRPVAIRQPKEIVYTHSYGLTWSRIVHENGTVEWMRDYAVKKVKGKAVKTHKPTAKTKDKNIEEVRFYIRERLVPMVQRYAKVKMKGSIYVALIVASYQGDGYVKAICKKLETAKTEQDIMDAFVGNVKGFGGTYKRRWICAAIATQKISPVDMLDAYVDGFYAADATKLGTKTRFKMDAKTVAQVLKAKQIKNNVPKVREELASCSHGKKILEKIQKDGSLLVVTGYDIKYAEALAAFKAKQYTEAEKLYLALIKSYPNNAELYNDLALVYYKMGKYDDGIKKIHDILYTLKDKSQFRAAYYNAGMIREKQGKLGMAKTNYQNAVNYGNTAAAKDVKRLDEQINIAKQVANTKRR